jgi:5-methylcytosine-specific restriction endonuclease McrA
MRPLDKGSGDGYKPATELSWNKYYDKKVTANWTALNALTGKGDDSTLKLETKEALQLVLNLNTGQPIETLTTPKTVVDKKVVEDQKSKATTAITEKTAEIYKEAAGPLCKALGTFCAYCETNITGLVEVDHVANKSEYPTYTTTWENFLPACGACNSKKSNKPTREEEAKEPPRPKIEGDKLKEDLPFYNKIRAQDGALNPDYYRWPDTSSGTFEFFKIRFEAQLQGKTFLPITHAEAATPSNQITEENISKREVCANVWYQGVNRKNKLVQVVVEPDGGNLTVMCGLNENTVQKGSNVTYDRRVYNRTRAWFEVLDTIEPLRTTKTTKDVDAHWPAILRTSKHVGFWSVWVTLLNQMEDPETKESLAKRFCSDKNISYPGTNRKDLKF